MLEKVALIPDEDWRENDVAYTNGVIAGIFAEADGNPKPAKSEGNVETILDTSILRSALADFSYDDLKNLMRMVPFPSDLSDLEDERLQKDISELLELLRSKSERLLASLETKQIDEGFRRELQDYAGEVKRPLRDLRPRLLMFSGTDLHEASLDSWIADVIGDRLQSQLERLVEQHFELMRHYFAAALARTGHLDKVEIDADATPSSISEALKSAFSGVLESETDNIPKLDENDAAVLKSRLDEITLEATKLDAADSDVDPAKLAKFNKKAKALAVTLVRLSLRSLQVAGQVGDKALDITAKTAGVAGVSYVFLPVQTRVAFEQLLAIFKNIPWPI